jgi:hypothetical protein
MPRNSYNRVIKLTRMGLLTDNTHLRLENICIRFAGQETSKGREDLRCGLVFFTNRFIAGR